MFLGRTQSKNCALKLQQTQEHSPLKSHKIWVSPFGVDSLSNITGGNAVLEIPVPFDMPACSVGETTQNQNGLNHLNTSYQVHKQNLPTPIKVKNLLEALQGYEEEKLRVLQEGFSYGFHLGCTDLPSSKVSRNHKSAIEHPSVIQDFIAQGRELGRIAGPFPSPPFTHFVSSPLGVVPKSEPGKLCVIHDLSFPKSNSVNSMIPDENSTVQYDSIDNVTVLLRKFGQGALMAKTDIQDAFRIVPIHPNDYNLLGFSRENNYYYDKCLPMGASSSCQIFEFFELWFTVGNV